MIIILNSKNSKGITVSPVLVFLLTGSLFTGNQEVEARESFGLIADLMMIEDQSLYDFDETVERFREEIDAAGWGILNYHDMQEVKAGHGFEVMNVKVFDLCSAEYSYNILRLDDERIVSPMMPCRISIYEKNDGNTYISRMNSPLVARFFGGEINETMQIAAAETEEVIEKLITGERIPGSSAFEFFGGLNYTRFADSALDNSFGFHLGSKVNLTRTIGLSAEYERYSPSTHSLNGLVFTGNFDLVQSDNETPLTLSALLGTGYYFGSVNNADFDSGFGAKIGAEINMEIQEQLNFVGNINYRNLDLDADDGESYDLSGFEFKTGLTYTF